MGKASFWRKFLGVFVLAAALFGSVTAWGKVIYVDADALGANAGTSWENAYNYLQDGPHRCQLLSQARRNQGR